MYYQSDYILRLIEDAAKFIAKVLNFYQESEIENIIDEDGMIDELTFFEYRLNKLFYSGNYGEAEEMLFAALDQTNGQNYLNTALDFYRRLGQLEPEKLTAGGFSEERIASGLERMRALFSTDEDEA